MRKVFNPQNANLAPKIEPQPQSHAGYPLHIVEAEFLQAAFGFSAAQPCHSTLHARDRLERRQLLNRHSVDVLVMLPLTGALFHESSIWVSPYRLHEDPP